MQIMMRDGRVFQGTGEQIVRQMQELAFGKEHLSLPEYIDWVVEQIERFENASVGAEGDTATEKATALVQGMLEAELAVKM